MAIFNTPLGMNVKNNPIKYSPFVISESIGDNTPPPSERNLLTESGEFILAENGDFLTTE